MTTREKLRAGYGECQVCHKLLKPDKRGYPLRHGGHAHPCPGVRYPLQIPAIPDLASEAARIAVKELSAETARSLYGTGAGS